jgi:hypothetical protein
MLMQTSMKHDLEAAHASRPDKFVEQSINLISRLSPLSGMGINDVVHLSGDEVISLPCLPFAGSKEGRPPIKPSSKTSLKTMQPSESVKNPDQDIELIQRLSPLSGMGMNDVIHLSSDEVISVPCLPFMGEEEEEEGNPKTTEQVAASPASRKLRAAMIAADWATNLQKNTFGTPMSPQGLTDVVHLPDGSVIKMPMLPFHHSKLARK